MDINYDRDSKLQQLTDRLGKEYPQARARVVADAFISFAALSGMSNGDDWVVTILANFLGVTAVRLGDFEITPEMSQAQQRIANGIVDLIANELGMIQDSGPPTHGPLASLMINNFAYVFGLLRTVGLPKRIAMGNELLAQLVNRHMREGSNAEAAENTATNATADDTAAWKM